MGKETLKIIIGGSVFPVEFSGMRRTNSPQTKSGDGLVFNKTERLQDKLGRNNRWGFSEYRSGFPLRKITWGKPLSGVRVISAEEARLIKNTEKALKPRL